MIEIDDELRDEINNVMERYKAEVLAILSEERYLEIFDFLFLIPIGTGDDSVTDDFIDGYFLGLFHAKKIPDDQSLERLKDIVKSARTLVRL